MNIVKPNVSVEELKKFQRNYKKMKDCLEELGSKEKKGFIALVCRRVLGGLEK